MMQGCIQKKEMVAWNVINEAWFLKKPSQDPRRSCNIAIQKGRRPFLNNKKCKLQKCTASLPPHTCHRDTLSLCTLCPCSFQQYTSKSSKTCVASKCPQCLKRSQKERGHICRQVDSQCGLLVCEGATIIELCTLWRALPPREIHSHSLSHNACAETFLPHFI